MEHAHPDPTEVVTAPAVMVVVTAPPKEVTAPVVTREVTAVDMEPKMTGMVTGAHPVDTDREHRADMEDTVVDSKGTVTARDIRGECYFYYYLGYR